MGVKINKGSKACIGMCARHNHAKFFLSLFFSWNSIAHLPLMAQVTKPDSLKIAAMISQSQDQMIKHNYPDAIRIAQEGLDKSTKLDFKWGLINSLLLIGQSQKSLSNYPASLNHYLQALSEIQKQNNKQALVWINLKIGELFQDWGVPEKALPYYNAVLNLQTEKTNEESATLIERIAEVYLNLNQKDKSLDKYFQLLEHFRIKKEALQTKRILEKIAFIYSQSNDIENSLKYNLQLLEIKKQLADPVSTAATLNVIGNHYKDMKNFDKALEYYQAALAMNQQASKQGENDNRIVANLINIGTIYQLREDSRNAIKNFNEALKIKEKTGSPVEIAVMHNYLASLYLAQRNYPEAEDHTKVSITLLSGTDNKRLLARNYKRLSEIYQKQDSYEKALTSYQAYSLLNDSLLYLEQIAQEKVKLK